MTLEILVSLLKTLRQATYSINGNTIDLFVREEDLEAKNVLLWLTKRADKIVYGYYDEYYFGNILLSVDYI